MKNKVGRIFFVLSYTTCREDVGGKRIMAPLILSFGAETVVMLQPPTPAGLTEKSFRNPLDRRLRIHRAVLGAATEIVSPCSTGNGSLMSQIMAYFGSLRAETKYERKQHIEAE
jgi:hypothetical protein